MKKLIFTILLITSFSTFACPNLGGNYQVCRSQKNILIEGSDLKVQQFSAPGTAVFRFSMLPDGTREREEVTFIANGSEMKDSWVGPTGIKYERVMFGKCLGNLLQWHTKILADGAPYVNETSQYFRQGDDLVRISRGIFPYGEKYFDILTCR
jgi:hypothetical protein